MSKKFVKVMVAVVAASCLGGACWPQRPVTFAPRSLTLVGCTSDIQCNSAPSTRFCSAGNTCSPGGACVFNTAPGCECWEGNVQPCTNTDYAGPCRKGDQQCTAAGQWGPCQSIVKPLASDQCGPTDDDNCNGTPHDACQCVNGTPCANGSVCVGGYCGTAVTPVTPPPVVCKPAPETCNNFDDNCDGVVDNIASTDCAAAAKGECAKGTASCKDGHDQCNPRPASAEFCDGKDNDCNGAVDDLKTKHNQSVTFAMLGLGWGGSANRLTGAPTCAEGGTRLSNAAVKTTGGDSHCEPVDEGWANVLCSNPGRAIGHSNLQDACNAFLSQGGVVNGDAHDCRFIVHLGTGPVTAIECQPSEVVEISDTCH